MYSNLDCAHIPTRYPAISEPCTHSCKRTVPIFIVYLEGIPKISSMKAKHLDKCDAHVCEGLVF